MRRTGSMRDRSRWSGAAQRHLLWGGGYVGAVLQGWGAGRRLQGVLLPLLLLVGWQLASEASEAARTVLSSPTAVAGALGEGLASGAILGDISTSLSRALGGWLLASATAIPIGLLIGRSQLARLTLGPVLNLLRPISPVAWIPLAILWLGIGYLSKVFIVAIVAFFIILANSIQAAETIDANLLKAARTLCKNRMQIAYRVIIPGSMRGVVTGAQFALTSAWGGVIIAEYTGASSGVGYSMLKASNVLLPDKVMAGMVTIAVVGYAMNKLFDIARRTPVGRKYL